jgi:hypothetical protein
MLTCIELCQIYSYVEVFSKFMIKIMYTTFTKVSML